MAETKTTTDPPHPETKEPTQQPLSEAQIIQKEMEKKYPLSMALSSLQPKGNKRKNDSYQNFSHISKEEINKSSRTFVTLYSMYERKPFLEPVENQETLENVTAEITFGISDDAFKVDVRVASEDGWLVPQDNVGVSYEDGFCEISLEPSPDQYGAADIFLEVHDVGGVSKHDFTLTIVQDTSKVVQKTKKKNPSKRFNRTNNHDDDDDDDYEDRSDNPNDWTTSNVCDWMLEKGLSKFAKIFATKDVVGTQLLALDGETLRDNYGVAKTRDRDKFNRALKILREEAELAEYAEREKKLEDEAREKLRLEKEARRAVARGNVGGGEEGGEGGGKDDSGAIVNKVDNGLDPWLCGHAPRITRGECGQVDMDAYGLMFELLKIQRLDHVSLRDSTFIDLAATDARFVMAAALGLPFLRAIGLQSVEAERVNAQRFVQRYNTRFRNDMPSEKRNQRIAVVPYLPHQYETLADGRIFYVHWPILEDLFYDVKHRFHYFTDLVSIMGRARRGSIMIVTDDDYQTPCDEEYDVEYAATRPGNTLEGWYLVRGPTTHHFSQGLRNIYVYKCIETLDSGTMEMLEELRDDEEENQKRLRELEEDAVGTNI